MESTKDWTNGKKKRFKQDPEEVRQFEDLKRKYANAIVYLLAMGVKLSQLRDYFADPVNTRRFDAIKKFRDGALAMRPKAKQYIDKPFYLDITIEEVPQTEAAFPVTGKLSVGDLAFKSTTHLVSTAPELLHYVQTLGKMLDGEKLWQDPDMAEFDLGHRDYTDHCTVKTQPEK